jgi:long-chain acyl-CoA synthetase
VSEHEAVLSLHGGSTAPPDFAYGEAPCQALLSSGSVGRPKIVLRSRSQVAAGVRIFAHAMGLGASDRVLLLVPLEHSVGFNSLMLGALSVGAQIVLPASRHPRGIVRDLEVSGVTLFPAPPLFFEWMYRFAESPTRRLSSVRVCVSVGDILPRTTYDGFVDTFGTVLWQSYGASEAGPSLLNRNGIHGDGVMALGQPYPEVDVDIRDDHGVTVANGATGEIVVRSPAVALGYVGEHDGSSRLQGGEFFTGDLGLRHSGEVFFSGRRKVLITCAGRKIDPGEVERVLCLHPEVIDAAVRIAGETGHDPLEALVVLRTPVAVEVLIQHCQGYLEPHKVPRSIQRRGELPRDAAGKLKRDQLRTW